MFNLLKFNGNVIKHIDLLSKNGICFANTPGKRGTLKPDK